MLFGEGWFQDGILFLAGIFLFSLEHVIPGTGFFALCGGVLIFGSIFLLLGANQTAVFIIATAIAFIAIAFLLLLRFFPTVKISRLFILKTQQKKQDGYVSGADYQIYLGRRAVTITPFRPAGKIEVDGVFFDAVSDGVFLEQGETVTVVRLDGGHMVVKKQ